MKVPPDSSITFGSVATAAMTRPGCSTLQPMAGSVTVFVVIEGSRARLRRARSVKVNPCHSEIDATP
jgi:hypothetical protein